MAIVELVVVGGAVAAIGTLVKYQNRPTATGVRSRRGGGSTGKVPGKSWLVTAWNAAGAPELKSGRPTAELAGKAAGRVARKGWRFTSKTGASWLARAERSRARRDAEIAAHGRKPLLVSRTPKPAPAPAAKPAEPAQPRPAAAPGPEPPAARTSTPAPSSSGADMTATIASPPNGSTAAVAPDWAALVGQVGSFDPTSDVELLQWMAAQTAGMLAYADAVAQVHENCVNGVGLDPSSMHGLGEYSQATTEAAHQMHTAHAQFVSIYQEVMAAVSNGVVMPFQGRFFTGAKG